MSFPTKPAFVHYGDWDDETRKHPAMNFMEDYTRNAIDSRKFDAPHSDWHSDNYSYLKSDGTDIKSGGKDAWAGVGATYAPFTAHIHQPLFLMCIETDYGYEMQGQAWVFANFPGDVSAGEQKHKDGREGKEWDMKVNLAQSKQHPSSNHQADIAISYRFRAASALST